MAVQPSETSPFETEIRIEAEPETVFAFFTDPEKMVRWMGTAATLDPRPGGVFAVTAPADPYAVEGQYLEVVPNERVVFTWGWRSFAGEDPPIAPGSSTVEVALVPDGGGTVLRLTHSDLPAETLEFHGGGWIYYLQRLAIVANAGDAGADPWAQAVHERWPEGLRRPSA